MEQALNSFRFPRGIELLAEKYALKTLREAFQ